MINHYHVYDVSLVPNPSVLSVLMDAIKHDEFRTKPNYLNLPDQLDQGRFLTYNILIDNAGDLIGASGLYTAPHYPPRSARALSRTYYAKKYRKASLGGSKSLADGMLGSRHLLPLEISVAHDELLDFVFYTNEFPNRRASLKRAITVVETDAAFSGIYTNKFTLEDRMYNVCPSVNDVTGCWQNAVTYPIWGEADMQSLPSISVDEYKKRFKAPYR